jgi:hypothetical protein
VVSKEVPTDDGETAEVGVAEILGTRPIDLSDVMTASGTDESEEVNDVGAWLLTYLREQGGEALRTDVMEAAKKAGHSSDQVKRARKRAGVVSGRTSEFPSKNVWHHPLNSIAVESVEESGQSAHGTLVSLPTASTALTAPTAGGAA